MKYLLLLLSLTLAAAAPLRADEPESMSDRTLKQLVARQKDLLAVFEREFVLGVHLSVASNARPGAIEVPGSLRYQACDETTCYAPMRAEAPR